MGSIAQDKQGNIALGYSSSSCTTHPGIEYVGRTISDPPNQLPQAAVHHHRRHRVSDRQRRPMGRLLIDADRPRRRLHVLVHQRVPTDHQRELAGALGSRSFKFPGSGGTVPTTPATVSAVPSNPVPGQFRCVLDGSGSADHRYKVTATPGGASCTTTGDPGPVARPFTGLTNGRWIHLQRGRDQRPR